MQLSTWNFYCSLEQVYIGMAKRSLYAKTQKLQETPRLLNIFWIFIRVIKNVQFQFKKPPCPLLITYPQSNTTNAGLVWEEMMFFSSFFVNRTIWQIAGK